CRAALPGSLDVGLEGGLNGPKSVEEGVVPVLLLQLLEEGSSDLFEVRLGERLLRSFVYDHLQAGRTFGNQDVDAIDAEFLDPGLSQGSEELVAALLLHLLLLVLAQRGQRLDDHVLPVLLVQLANLFVRLLQSLRLERLGVVLDRWGVDR